MGNDQYLNHLQWQKERGLYWPVYSAHELTSIANNEIPEPLEKIAGVGRVVFCDAEHGLDSLTRSTMEKMAKSINLDPQDYLITADFKQLPLNQTYFLFLFCSKNPTHHQWGRWFNFSDTIKALYTHHPLTFGKKSSNKVEVWQHLQSLKSQLSQL